MKNASQSEQRLLLLEFLMHNKSALYSLSSTERQRLHDREWSSKSPISILGEIEAFDDTISGYVSWALSGKLREAPLVRKALRSSIFDNGHFWSWLKDNAEQAPLLCAVVSEVELIRIALLELLADADDGSEE